MPTGPSVDQVATALPGTWHVRATNVFHWLDGARVDPVVSYELAAEDPLEIIHAVDFRTPDGKEKQIRSRVRWHRDHFTPHGSARFRLRRSPWAVAGISEDGSIAVVRYPKQGSAHGIDVLIRVGVPEEEHDAARALVSNNPERFQLGLEDFASLSWLRRPGANR